MQKTAAIVTIATFLFAVPALASQPDREARDRCMQAHGSQAYGWCSLAASFDAERRGDIRQALTLIDQAEVYLASEPILMTRSIALRAELGRTFSGYAREALYRCQDISAVKTPALRAHVIQSCKDAWYSSNQHNLTADKQSAQK